MTLRILATGGTLDKHYNELNGELTFSETHLTEIIALSRNTLPIIIETVMLIDSLDMQHPHRQQILERCEAAAEKYIASRMEPIQCLKPREC